MLHYYTKSSLYCHFKGIVILKWGHFWGEGGREKRPEIPVLDILVLYSRVNS